VGHTHGRSLRIADLRGLRLEIEDFTQNRDLADAIQRYHVLLRMTLDASNVFKLFETPTATVARRFNQPNAASAQMAMEAGGAEVKCPNCGTVIQVQVDFVPGVALNPGSVQYPNGGSLACPTCSHGINVRPVRAAIEQAAGRRALDPQPVR